MRTAIQITLVALTGLTLLGARSAPAQPLPTCPSGRFRIEGAPLDLGAGAEAISRLSVIEDSAPGDAAREFLVGLDSACDSFVATQAPRTDAVVVRARFRSCGERPRFRLRLAFDADCDGLVGRVRAAGQLVVEFRASRELRIVPPPPSDAGFRDVSDLAPTITGVSPAAGAAGDEITLEGEHFDHDRTGEPWEGTPPFVVRFRSASNRFGLVRADFVFVSERELLVTIPDDAATGEIFLEERLPGGNAGTRLTQSPLFEVEGTTDPISPTTTTTTRVSTTSTTTTTRPRFGTTTTTTRPRATTTSTTLPPAPVTATSATITIENTNLSIFDAGTFGLAASGPNRQIGALFDGNANRVVDGFPGASNVPYMRFPVPTSDFGDVTLTLGSGYVQGADTVIGAVVAEGQGFIAVHLDVAGTTATPRFMSAGQLVGDGIILTTTAFTEANVTVQAPAAGSPRIIRGHVAAVPSFDQLVFLPSQPGVPVSDEPGFFADPGPQIELRHFADGITLDFVLELPNDG